MSQFLKTAYFVQAKFTGKPWSSRSWDGPFESIVDARRRTSQCQINCTVAKFRVVKATFKPVK